MERSIDRHEVRSRRTTSNAMSKVNKWRRAWIHCYNIVEHYTTFDPKNFHTLFEQWVPILNYVFDMPIHLERYDVVFYYCNVPDGPKEVIQLFMDENPLEDRTNLHVIFNLYEFRAIHHDYCVNLTKSNKFLYNQARGTIHLSALHEELSNPAEFLTTMSGYHLLFIFTNHALAHWDVYEQYEHAHYDNHLHVRNSPFFNFHFLGELVLSK